MAFKMKGFSGFGKGTGSSFKNKPGIWSKIKNVGGKLNTIANAWWAADEGSKILTGKHLHTNVKDFFNPWGDEHGGKATVEGKVNEAKKNYKKQKKYGASSGFVGRKL